VLVVLLEDPQNERLSIDLEVVAPGDCEGTEVRKGESNAHEKRRTCAGKILRGIERESGERERDRGG